MPEVPQITSHWTDIYNMYNGARTVKFVHKCGRTERRNVWQSKLPPEYRLSISGELLLPASGTMEGALHPYTIKRRSKVFKLKQGLFEEYYEYDHEEML